MSKKIIKQYLYRCPLCEYPVHRYRITKLTLKKLKHSYIFTEYDKCENCSYIKLDNDYKIIISKNNKLL